MIYHTCSYDRVCDLDVLSMCDMNPISVRTFLRGCYRQTRSLNIGAFFKGNMNLLCIFDVQVLHYQVFALVEGESLKYSFPILLIKPKN